MEMGSPGKHGQTSRSWNLFFDGVTLGNWPGRYFGLHPQS